MFDAKPTLNSKRKCLYSTFTCLAQDSFGLMIVHRIETLGVHHSKECKPCLPAPFRLALDAFRYSEQVLTRLVELYTRLARVLQARTGAFVHACLVARALPEQRAAIPPRVLDI